MACGRGITSGSSTLFIGPCRPPASRFLVFNTGGRGSPAAERAGLFAFEEEPDSCSRAAKQMGIDLEAMRDAGSCS